MDRRFWSGKRVFLTGHTGFKGGWLASWLLEMGAEVHGLALAPEAPSFFAHGRLDGRMQSTLGDIRDPGVVERALAASRAELVFHLAAQSLVRRSYREPVETFAANVMGTAHVLDAVRRSPGVRVAIVVTSDKCYDNRDSLWGYREDDPLGGADPYSASKGCAEIVTAAYRRSFCAEGAAVSSVRAGNVIGGGDFSEDRIVPDAVRALGRAEPLLVRNPEHVRPWQHVLEPLSGYLLLAERSWEDRARYAGAWNFGPSSDDMVPVRRLADLVVRGWGSEARWEASPRAGDPHEARALTLDSTRARALLGWRPRWGLEEAVAMTVAWYRAALSGGADMADVTREQIHAYEERAPHPGPLPKGEGGGVGVEGDGVGVEGDGVRVKGARAAQSGPLSPGERVGVRVKTRGES